MRKSDIFESFVKIAQEKGMISEDAPDKAKKKLEQDPRADSLDISAIEALYGVKPDIPKDMEYEHNIMEDAHPNSVVISPSYDKLNGLVENNIERQNIILHIVHKTPDGLSTQRKYAEQELLMSLVRVANDLDNKNIDNLRTLADTCLMQVAPKPLQKSAQIIPIMGAVSALLGGLYLQQHLPMINEGFEKNHQKLVAEIDDMLSSNSDWGVGNQYKGQFTNMLQDFKTKLTSFYNQYKKSESVISELEKPKTAKELMEQAKQPETNSVMEAYKSLKDAFKEIIPYIGTIQKDFASESYKVKQIEDKGFFSDLLDKTQVLHGGKGLVADDFDDVARAIPPYMKSLNEMLGVLKGAESIQKDVQERLSAAEAKSEELFGNQSGNATPAQDVDKEVSQLEADLG
jgi:hypothetical protein